VVRAGEQVLALDVAHVHTTLPGCTPEPSVLAGGPCTGVTTFSGREVPVVDPLRVLGLGEPAAGELAAGERGAGLVLDTGTGYVVLAVDALLDLVEVPAQDVLAVPRSAIVRGDLVGALVDLPGLGQALVVDGAALRAEPALRALGSLNTELEGAAPAGLTGTAADRAAAALTGEPHLSYSAGADLLTPVGQVAEILPLPAQVTDTGAHPALRGVVVHRRAAVPVLCLATLLGLAPRADRGEGCLLLVQGDGGPVAFAVEGLRTIVHPTWQDDERPKGPPAVPGEALRCSPLAVVDEPAQLLPVLDLLGLAGLVQAPDEPAPLPREDLVDA
jgi:purine-binding chemotaxis protein CheW